MHFKTFTKRTNEPKLSWLERRLDAAGIENRRNGESFHAPILEVDAAKLDAAWAILDPVDDIRDDAPRFRSASVPGGDAHEVLFRADSDVTHAVVARLGDQVEVGVYDRDGGAQLIAGQLTRLNAYKLAAAILESAGERFDSKVTVGELISNHL